MPIINSIAARQPYFANLRKQLHQMPELGFDTFKTAAFVVSELRRMGIDEVHEGIAQNGVIAVIRGKGNGRTIALRADMDALPIHEKTGKEYASKIDGVMHACGHDGHTSTLLAAAEHLIQNQNFDGDVVLVFQPAEEAGGGAGVMVKEGVIERFGIEEIYALHNLPGLALGKFEICEGPIMAATSTFDITVTGRGGHAAWPETCVDPIPIAIQLINAIYTIKSRGVTALEPCVISVTQFHAGSAENIVPETVFIQGTVRSLSSELGREIGEKIEGLAIAIPAAFGAKGEARIYDGYPATINHQSNTKFAVEAACKIVGSDNVEVNRPPEMGAEDFAFFVEKIPGAYGFFGTGEGAVLHNERYDFNDDLIPIGASWFVEVANARAR